MESISDWMPFASLQKANIELGINYVQEIGASVPVDDRVKIKARSIMGTEIPLEMCIRDRFCLLSNCCD